MQEELGINKASELVKFTQADLVSRYGDKTGNWIYHIARGRDSDPVKHRAMVKQSACSKNFPQGIKKADELKKWLTGLSEELEERLAFELSDNKRVATQFTVGMRLKSAGSTSVQMPLTTISWTDEGDGVLADPIYMVSLCAGRFVAAPEPGGSNIYNMLKNMEIQKGGPSEKVISTNSSKGKERVGKENVPNNSLTGFFTPQPCTTQIRTPPTGVASVPASSKSAAWNNLSEEDTQIMLETKNKKPTTEKLFTLQTDKTKCPQCGKTVLESKLAEHLDFHVARDLQRQIETELRREDPASNRSPAIPGIKRKVPQIRQTAKKQKLVASPSSKSIASFFKKT
eukprot:sb/3466386/